MRADGRKILLFEMNEVPWRVLDDYARRRPRSHLAKLLADSKQLETVCEDQVELDPWTSWPTFHRGVIDEQHRIRHLGQPLEWADARYPPVWELLARQGRRAGVFGSLHSSHTPDTLERYAFYVPDFFADGGFARPARLQAFQDFNLLMTRRSARNVDPGIPLRAAAGFLRDYVRHGLNWGTAGKTLAALADERLRPHRKSRRRSLQPLFGFDLFLPLVRSTLPDLATFYTNHVAANMHRFWAAAYPDDVAAEPMPVEWRRMYAGEIDYAMDILDGMLGRARALAQAADYLLLCAGSIGQAGCPGERTTGFVTITDLPRFMARMGVPEGRWTQKPAMVPCLGVALEAEYADRFEARLASLTVGKYRVRKAQREGVAPFTFDRAMNSFHLFVYFDELDVSGEAAELGFGRFRQEEGVACSGRHTPFGALLVYDPRRRAAGGARTTISTLDVAPALLGNFGIHPPGYMAAPDPHLLDVTRPGRAGSPFHGGGIETPVLRSAPLHSAIA
jgi:hypothetical protein